MSTDAGDDTPRYPRQLVLDNPLELNALHRALHTIKFNDDASFDIFAGSPFIASIQHQLIDALAAGERQEGREPAAARWEQWRSADAHPDATQAVRDHLARNPPGSDWTAAELVNHVLVLFAPLKPSAELLQSVVDGVSRQS